MFMPTVFHENLFDDLFDPFWNEGALERAMNREARDHAEEIAARIPAGRIGQDEDMAGAAIFLASRAGDYVLGSTLVVDGGVTHAR